jgi:single-strand DNA-binding protein
MTVTTRPRAGEDPTGSDPASPYRNEILLCGRLAAPAIAKQLPSGDDIVSWRLIVDRSGGEGARKVDVVDCAAWRPRVRRQALAWGAGEVIEVSGALRRRFWRGAAGLQSKCEVEVDAARRRGTPTPRRGRSQPRQNVDT